ncbi:Lhr family ATP-dependent helicase [Labedella endophytica]|uniref:DEAD/DEAH box helicase n=1 Tax=Labedella endophytica TaxID=1523160 RepID=A0A3S0XAA6_9MICO|nr:DEAD/DEAH box helicase [Labedella endophytica]RUR03585.1 DEAD/DEAH box helicase [Labedella endophytica]
MTDILDRFSPATREWFAGAFEAPTRAQAGAWDAISRGSNALVVAPTGSGKTLSAFLWSIDRLISAAPSPNPRPAGSPAPGTRVLYISPLKALGVDVERNLRSPLVGVTQTAKRLGLEVPDIRVGVRSGDTPQSERRALLKSPPDILITTPESLFLLLTSAARETLRDVSTIIVDEVHALAGSKRGAHLAVSLERLDDLLEKPAQRIGLSATVRPHEEVARFLCGRAPVEIVAPTADKKFDLTVVVPVDDMTDPGSGDPAPTGPREGATAGSLVQDGERSTSIWPHVEEAIVDRILDHRSTIVFANSRRLAERLTARFNEIWEERNAPAEESEEGGAGPVRRAPAALMGGSGQTKGSTAGTAVLEPGAATENSGAPLARAHHGSVSKEQRAEIEDALKTGRLRCVVATSSLELGIDMGDVDLVVQVETPPSVASGLQRVGRAGHQVGEISRGVLFPKHRSDLVSTAVATERMVSGQIERLSVPANPLDVLAQQTVAVCALDTVEVEAWFETVRRSAPFRSLPRSAFEATLDLLAGRYPSDDFAELRPRLVWDRDAGTLTGRPGAQRLAVTSGGTIPDRGMFAVHMVGGDAKGGTRVGELDEEMVYESRVGDVFALGATSWTIQEITHDRVLVTPAFGQPGRLPFWKGDGLGRPAELGEAIGAFMRETDAAPKATAEARLAEAGLDSRAIGNLLTYLAEQKRSTGQLPSDKTLVVERSRDELGDWRVILHSPYGMHVHAPWALAVAARVRERLGVDGGATASDDGIIVRIPDTDSEPPGADLFVIEPDELEAIVRDEVGGSALFASRFRECAARALLLPNRRPGSRAPLWQQRQRSAQLLDVAKRYPDFPILLETVRECLQDVYDLPALLDLAKRIENRSVRVVETTTDTPSPFATSLLFGYVGAFMYEGDSPLAERRAAALALDQGMLSELLGHVELRELLDPGVITRTELELQRLAPERRMRGIEGVADLVRMLGPLTVEEVAERLESEGDEARSDTVTSDARDDTDSDDVAPPHASVETARAHLEALSTSRRVIRASFAGAEWWSAIEDASRLRDALGVPLPIGVPVAFIEPVADPLGDLVARYARTHGPFTTGAVARRFGLGAAVARHTLGRLADERRVLSGEFLAAARDRGADDDEWCDAEVLRRLRLRSLAALRHEVEPVDQQTFARFLPDWQHVSGSLRGVDGVLTVIEQLAGVPIPASAWESLVLPQRVRDYSPSMLDELTATGEVSWSGAGSLPGADGWVALHPADAAAVTLPINRDDHEPDALQREILLSLGSGGAYFFSQLAESTGSDDDKALVSAIWELVWAGLITNDTFSPLRMLTGGGGAHRSARATPRARTYRGRAYARPTMTTRVANGGSSAGQRLGGRWSILPLAESDPTIRAAATAEILLDRYGIVTRGSVATEGVPGGFALAYKVLSGFEEKGRARRGYIIDGLGAAQFSTSGTVDRVRTFVRTEARGERPGEKLTAVTLAATDPANPYGAALPWPSSDTTGTKHRPGRKAGGLVTIVDGELVFYLERGGSSLLVFTEDERLVGDAAMSLAGVVRDGRIEKLAVENANGDFVLGGRLALPLREAGFSETPRGLRIRRA